MKVFKVTSTEAESRYLYAALADFSRGGAREEYAAWLEDWAYSLYSAQPDKLYVKQRLRLAGASALDLTWEQAIAQTPRMLVFGDPGSGKTTLGQRICYEIGAKHRRSFELAFSIPLRQRRHNRLRHRRRRVARRLLSRAPP